MTPERNSRRAAVVAGCRTPFCKAGTIFDNVSAVDLARHATLEVLQRSGLEGHSVDLVVMGQVIQSPLAPNLAREVSLLPQFPRDLPAYTVGEACASANQALANAVDQITLGHADIVIAGGAESLSNIPILHSKQMSNTLIALSRSRTLKERLRLVAGLRPRDFIPVSPAIAEPSTGQTMGQSAEKMAMENKIRREDQDAWAFRSHHLAHTGNEDGRLLAEIAPFPIGNQMILQDNGIRSETSVEQMAKLRPVFDRHYGTVTAANSSPLTDGASAVLLVEEKTARTRGLTPLASVRSYALTAVDPAQQLLMGPVSAVPLALKRAGIEWCDLGLVEMHEAFSAQVLSNIQGFEQQHGWTVNREILNVMGGSIAIGHPFGATGGRIVTTLANEMQRREVQFGLVSVCAQGGLGFAMVLEHS